MHADLIDLFAVPRIELLVAVFLEFAANPVRRPLDRAGRLPRGRIEDDFGLLLRIPAAEDLLARTRPHARRQERGPEHGIHQRRFAAGGDADHRDSHVAVLESRLQSGKVLQRLCEKRPRL